MINIKGKSLLAVFIAGMVVISLAGCGNTKKAQEKVKGLDKLGAIHVISREEDSGTRNTFAELAGLKENNSRNQDNTLEGVILRQLVMALPESWSAIPRSKYSLLRGRLPAKRMPGIL